MSIESKLWYGLDPERSPSEFSDCREERKQLEEMIAKLDAITQWLREDERLVLELVRGGKGPTAIMRTLGLKSKQAAARTIQHVVTVAKFYCTHTDAINSLSGIDGQLVKDFLVGRMKLSEFATKYGMTRDESWDLVREVKSCAAPAVVSAIDEYMAMQVGGVFTKGRPKMAGTAWRDEFRQVMQMLIEKGVWYEWGGQKPFARPWGVADCSGLVIEVLKKVGRLPKEFPDTGVRGLTEEFSRVKVPSPGDVVFYGGSDAKAGHIMFYLGGVVRDGNGKIRFSFREGGFPGMKEIHEHAVIGMGGGRKNMQSDYARIAGAGLWIRRAARYRRDFLRFGKVS